VGHDPNARKTPAKKKSGRSGGGPVLGGQWYTVEEQRAEGFIGGGGHQWQAPMDGIVTPMLSGPSAAAANSAQTNDPMALGRAVRAALEGVVVVMNGRQVGVIQGRQADLLARAF
jgi:hypothetical protein